MDEKEKKGSPKKRVIKRNKTVLERTALERRILQKREASRVDLASLRGRVPDDEDRENIANFIKAYKEAHPPEDPYSLESALEDAIKSTDNKKKQRKGDKAQMTRIMSFPTPFVLSLKEAYPLIFIDKVQFEWFVANFPEYDLRKY